MLAGDLAAQADPRSEAWLLPAADAELLRCKQITAGPDSNPDKKRTSRLLGAAARGSFVL